MRIVPVIASTLLLLGTSVAIAQPAPPPLPDEEDAGPAFPAEDLPDDAENPDPVVVTGIKEKKVCRRHTPTGSRVPVKICRTQSQEREQIDATREVMTELQSAGGKEVEYDENGFPIANPF